MRYIFSSHLYIEITISLSARNKIIYTTSLLILDFTFPRYIIAPHSKTQAIIVKFVPDSIQIVALKSDSFNFLPQPPLPDTDQNVFLGEHGASSAL
jgi:hypothetical protein